MKPWLRKKKSHNGVVWVGLGWGNTNPMSCYATWPSSTLLHELDATLLDLHLHFYMGLMPRCLVSSALLHGLDVRCSISLGASTWTWCYAAPSSSALLHELDATLLDLPLRFYMNLVLHATLVTWSSSALLHELDVSLLDLPLLFYIFLMLRHLISSAFLHVLDAALLDFLCALT